MARLRVFVAVPIPESLSQQAQRLIGRLSKTSASVRWAAPQTLHWTVQFLGEIDQVASVDVCRAAAQVASESRPFEIHAQGAGAFPNNQRPRTIWLGVGQGEEEFVRLHDAVAAALAPLGFEDEARRFHPHLTLGRVRSNAGLSELSARLAEHATFDAGEMIVDELAVYSSELKPAGPVYTLLASAPLGRS